MLNPALDVDCLQRKFAENRRLRVEQLLESNQAEAVHHCLDQQVPWTLAYRTQGVSRSVASHKYKNLTQAEREELREQALDEARNGFSFAYNSYMMIPAYLEKRDPGLLLHRLVEFLNSDAFIGFARALTADERIVKADAQATWYQGGHFLTQHDDSYDDEGRLYAFVLGMSKQWQADWGGLLMFLNPDGQVCETSVPGYNCLSVFQVPVAHCVSMVVPFATGKRLSITGWFRS